MTRSLPLLSLPLVPLLGLVGCAEEPETLSTYAEVEPIVAEHCLGCHAEGGSAGVALDSYAAASANADGMVDRAVDAEGGAMPPSGLVLSAEQAEVLVAWAEAGAPE